MARRTTMVVAAAARHYAWVGGVAARKNRGVTDFTFFLESGCEVPKFVLSIGVLASNASYGVR